MTLFNLKKCVTIMCHHYALLLQIEYVPHTEEFNKDLICSFSCLQLNIELEPSQTAEDRWAYVWSTTSTWLGHQRYTPTGTLLFVALQRLSPLGRRHADIEPTVMFRRGTDINCPTLGQRTANVPPTAMLFIIPTLRRR